MSHRYDKALESIRRSGLRLDAALRAYQQGDEEAEMEEAFGAPTTAQRIQLAADKAEVELLEAKAQAEIPREPSRRNVMWSWRKRGL